MENYILQKDLPDALSGTKILWNEDMGCFYYNRRKPFHTIFEFNDETKGILSKTVVLKNPEWFAKEIVKPPLGLIPYWLHTELRLKDINEAIARREGTQFKIPAEWIAEKQTLQSFINGRKLDDDENTPLPCTTISSERENDIKAFELYMKISDSSYRRLQLVDVAYLRFCENLKNNFPFIKPKDSPLPKDKLEKSFYEIAEDFMKKELQGIGSTWTEDFKIGFIRGIEKYLTKTEITCIPDVKLLRDCWSEACAVGHQKFPSLSDMQKEFEKWLDEKNIKHN